MGEDGGGEERQDMKTERNGGREEEEEEKLEEGTSPQPLSNLSFILILILILITIMEEVVVQNRPEVDRITATEGDTSSHQDGLNLQETQTKPSRGED